MYFGLRKSLANKDKPKKMLSKIMIARVML